MDKIKNIGTIVLCGLVLFGLAITCWIKAPQKYSDSERRTLAKAPKVTQEALIQGSYMNDFETYSLDQFPLRDGFRTVKAVVSRYAFGQKDNHGLYSIRGILSKLEYPMNEEKVDQALAKLQEIREVYLDGTECTQYLSIIPDKNYFLAPEGGYPMMDYQRLTEKIITGCDTCNYIDIFDLLSLEDYYKTDQHWDQQHIQDVAERIGKAMSEGTFSLEVFDEKTLDQKLYGAYVGQSALSYPGDTVRYLTNDTLEQAVVTDYDSGSPREAKMYDLKKAEGKDVYEMFLSGSTPLITIENPKCHNGKQLVVFRDSFGSSLIPLLVSGYENITVVDLRYIRSDMLGNYITFTDQDVLFLYSTLIFNNSISQ